MLTGRSSYMPGRLPGLTRGRDDRMVCFLQPGRFSILGMALQSLPPLLCIWTQMEHLGGPPGRLAHLSAVGVHEHRVGGVRAPAQSTEFKTSSCLHPASWRVPLGNSLKFPEPVFCFCFQNHATEHVRKSVGTRGSSDWLFPLPEMLLPQRWTGRVPHLAGLREHRGCGVLRGLLRLCSPGSLGDGAVSLPPETSPMAHMAAIL